MKFEEAKMRAHTRMVTRKAIKAVADAVPKAREVKTEIVEEKIPLPSGIFILEVRVRNVRCLRSVDVHLDSLTLLIGQNNAGKTSFLHALFTAVGIGPRSISGDDVFLAKDEDAVPKDRSIVIDLLIRPTDNEGKTIGTFPSGSPWLELWGSGVVQDNDDRDIVAIRTTLKWNAMRAEYVLERRFLKDWQQDGSKWEESKPVEKIPPVSAQQIEPLGLYLLDAKRDGADDLRAKGSFWGRMVEDHGLTKESVEKIEEELSLINEAIVTSSEIFTHIQNHLRGFHDTLSCEQDSIAITPLARHLRDLSRGMDVVLSTHGAPPFPLHQQGMGTRSLGTFFTFWAFTTWRLKQAATNAIHPLMALEEPETHLHPQAQRALFRQIKRLPGQRIISTHSPYICGQAEVAQMRHFSKRGAETVVNQIDLRSGDGALTPEDLRNIDRQIMNTRGDILFARAIVLFEGDTEEQAIPDFAERYWDKHPNDLGFSFVSVGGNGNYLPFLRMAQSFMIPWFIFSDGEPATVTAVNAALKAIGQTGIPNNSRVVVIPDDKDFEAHLINEQNRATLVQLVIDAQSKSPQHREALTAEWTAKGISEQLADLSAIVDGNKTQYGARVGKALPIPKVMEEMFKKVDSELGLGK